MSVPAHVYQVYIRCTPQAAWEALIDGEKTVQYYYSTRVESDWSPGSAIRYLSPGGDVVADGEVIAFEPPGRLEITFHARWDPELEAEGPIRMVWRVEGSDGPTSVTAELHDIDTTSRTFQDFVGGLPLIVSGLKTLLETGSPLSTA